MFADDKNVVISDKDPNNLIRKANDELENISQYMTANQLIINKSKTSYLMLKPKQVQISCQLLEGPRERLVGHLSAYFF